MSTLAVSTLNLCYENNSFHNILEQCWDDLFGQLLVQSVLWSFQNSCNRCDIIYSVEKSILLEFVEDPLFKRVVTSIVLECCFVSEKSYGKDLMLQDIPLYPKLVWGYLAGGHEAST